MMIERPVLNRSIMERYEITEHRPSQLRAVLFGADEIMLGGVARYLQKINVGALCVTEKAELLNEQDCMFTVLERGASLDKTHEVVIQSILCAVDPDKDFDEFVDFADREGIDAIFCHAETNVVEYALVTRFLYRMREKEKKMPAVLAVSDLPENDCAERIKTAFQLISARWGETALADQIDIRPAALDGLYGMLSDKEAQRQQQDMNYSDSFIMWAQPKVSLKIPGTNVLDIVTIESFDKQLGIKAATDCTLEFLCAAGGYLAGENTFADVLGNEMIRKWIAHAWFDEILPSLPGDEKFKAATIEAFEKYEDPYNNIPLMSVRGMMSRLTRTLLPSIVKYADENFEAPKFCSLALAAAIMIYAGVRAGDKGYEIFRGEASDILNDDPEVLQAFSCLSHDMPAETLTYAVLADRALWNMDLREIAGLETSVMNDISAIQRVGFRETLKYLIADMT